eukprot:3161929-Prymnesium_polylepis.2
MNKNVDFVFLLLIYIYITIVLTILLLNLLIAMMGSTYSSILEDSRLQWRLNFARRLKRLELQTRFLSKPSYFWRPWEQHAGTRNAAGVYTYEFQSVAPNVEGRPHRDGEGAQGSKISLDDDYGRSATDLKKENAELKQLVHSEMTLNSKRVLTATPLSLFASRTWVLALLTHFTATYPLYTAV